MKDTWTRLQLTDYARYSINPMWKLKFEQKVVVNPDKDIITLQLGDPTVFGNFPPPKELRDAIKKAVDLDNFSYNAGEGKLAAREAVAEYSKHRGEVTADDVILASGCGHALEMCIMSLVAPGENLLYPIPCYRFVLIKVK